MRSLFLYRYIYTDNIKTDIFSPNNHSFPVVLRMSWTQNMLSSGICSATICEKGQPPICLRNVSAKALNEKPSSYSRLTRRTENNGIDSERIPRSGQKAKGQLKRPEKAKLHSAFLPLAFHVPEIIPLFQDGKLGLKNFIDFYIKDGFWLWWHQIFDSMNIFFAELFAR